MVDKLKDDCQKYTECVHEQVLEIVPISMESLPWVSWELEASAVSDENKRK